MIAPDWKRIAAIHVEDEGTVGAVWLALDPVTNVLHCYDAAMFRVEVKAVIAEGIGARGRRFPVAWRKKDKAFADLLLDAGINMLPEPCDDTPAMAEAISREVWQKLRTGQFRVDRSVGDWLQEYRRFDREDARVPKSGFPLMAATRHAIEMLPYARAERTSQSKRRNYPSQRAYV